MPEELKAAFAWNQTSMNIFFVKKATPNPYIMDILKSEESAQTVHLIQELLMSDAVGLKGHDIMFSST